MFGAAAAVAASGLLLRGNARPARAAAAVHHLVWAWQLSSDGEPNVLGARLRDYNLGLILKTHDGVTWMSEYDKSRFAVSSPSQVEVLAKYFEDAGVPFHAWCVVHGTDPIKEAQMAAAVLMSGARSMYLDIEPHSGFWRGKPADAVAFGNELRRLVPNAPVVLSVDPRPWMLERLPMQEFADFSDYIAPQNYWRTFNTPPNYERFAQTGYPVPPEGTTPEFLLNVSKAILPKYGLPIIQVGQGDTPHEEEWQRFVGAAMEDGDFVTVWRYGVTRDGVLQVLRNNPARQPVVAPAMGSYTVQPGDTLGGIADAHGMSVEDLMAINGLTDPDYVYVGQELQLSGSTVVYAASVETGDSSGSDSDQTYTVEDGDTLYSIADKFGTTVDSIVGLNGLPDPDYLYIGQELHIA